jgi:uncharacterized membrane protein YagU involved in acid resistance
MGATTGGFLVRGFIAGTISAWIMDRATWFVQDRQPPETLKRERAAWKDGLDVPHVAVYRLRKAASFPAKREQPSTLGILLHYLFGIGPAILYASLRERDQRYSADRGLLYGLAIFLLWDEALSVATGIASPPQAYPWQAHLRGLVGHLSLGVATHVALTALETDFDIRPMKQRHPGAR